MAQSGISIVPSDAERIGHTVPWTGVMMFQVLTSTSGRSAGVLDRDVAAFNHYSAGRDIKCSGGGPRAVSWCDLVCAKCVPDTVALSL